METGPKFGGLECQAEETGFIGWTQDPLRHQVASVSEHSDKHFTMPSSMHYCAHFTDAETGTQNYRNLFKAHS